MYFSLNLTRKSLRLVLCTLSQPPTPSPGIRTIFLKQNIFLHKGKDKQKMKCPSKSRVNHREENLKALVKTEVGKIILVKPTQRESTEGSNYCTELLSKPFWVCVHLSQWAHGQSKTEQVNKLPLTPLPRDLRSATECERALEVL